MNFDLLTTIEDGGCSAKLSAAKLAEVLKDLPATRHERLLVGIETHDDAGVYKLTDDIALIQTTDFFPPVCSDPFEFGQIAAANALSDVFAMGGTALTAMNLAMFPSRKIPLEVLGEIFKGGAQKVNEAGAVVVGGHTIDDDPPKFGLAVTGIVHPDRIITNSAARAGDLLVLSKPIGSGVIIAGKRVGEAKEEHYRQTLGNMKQLNDHGARLMQSFNVRCATDITGFGLLGHARKMAIASNVSIRLKALSVPLLPGALDLAAIGCLPGAAFRNQEFAQQHCSFSPRVEYSLQMLLFDAQTSGGLLMCVPSRTAVSMVENLKKSGYYGAAIVGEVVEKTQSDIFVE
jgi:selenide, water dikinase